MYTRPPLSKEDAAARLPIVAALLAAWTNGDRSEATEDVCDLAIMTVEMLHDSLITGETCMSRVPLEDLSFRASAERNGFRVEKIADIAEPCTSTQ